MKRIAPSLFFFGLLSVATAEAQTTTRRTLDGAKIAIHNLAGRVIVSGAPAGTGSVGVEVTLGGRDAGQLRVEQGPLSGWETLRVIFPGDRIVYPREPQRGRTRTTLRVRDDGTFNSDEWRSDGHRVEVSTWGSGTEAWADLRLSVPPGRQLSVNLALGEATITNVDGDISVDVQGASVKARGTRGRLSLDTGSGDVEVVDAQGDVSLDAGSGGALLEGVSGAHLTIDAGSGSVRGRGISVTDLNLDSGSGDVRLVEVRSKDVIVDSGSGSVDIDLASDVDRMRVDAGSGGVTIGVPASLGAVVRISTGSGGIDLDVPMQVTRHGRRSLEGRLGDGRGELAIETGSGGVRFRRAVSDR